VPGRLAGPRVVVSRGALRSLSEGQLRQVLAHERAHISARHDLILLVADTFVAVLGGRLGSRRAKNRLAELVEMHADDAVRGDDRDRRSLAEAVLVLAGGGRVEGALGAGGSAASRVRRLTAPDRRVPSVMRYAVVAGLVVLLSAPTAIALMPGWVSLFLASCPFLF
jgi:beta-lactamase regulating signal transducer with metallopeptidase domain